MLVLWRLFQALLTKMTSDPLVSRVCRHGVIANLFIRAYIYLLTFPCQVSSIPTNMHASIQFSVYIHLNNRYEYIHTCFFLLDVFHIGNHACFDRLSRTSLVIHLNISLTRLLLQARSSAVLFIYLSLYYIKSAAYIWT